MTKGIIEVRDDLTALAAGATLSPELTAELVSALAFASPVDAIVAAYRALAPSAATLPTAARDALRDCAGLIVESGFHGLASEAAAYL